MTYHVALDVSLKETHLSELAPGGLMLTGGRAASEPEALAAWLRGPGAAAAVLETGGL